MLIDWHHFTAGLSLAGGLLIGLSAALLLLLAGRIAGISGILGGLISGWLNRPARADGGWRIAFLGGLICAPLLATALGFAANADIDAGWPSVLIAGFVVGLGTRYAGGCTSGHGVCGLSRGATRSLVATASFMAAGFITVFVLRHLGGG
jgi:uncharacterized membrane protein YedE/YeeE